MSNEVLLIVGSFTSANFSVMLDVIKCWRDDARIHAIAATNMDGDSPNGDESVKCYPVRNGRRHFLDQLKVKHPHLWHGVDFVMSHFYGILDNYIRPDYEKEIEEMADALIEKYAISTVFSVCRPFYAHRVAASLQNKRGIKWYQIWLDSYSNNAGRHTLLERAINGRTERYLFQKAERIYALPEIFIGDKIINDYKEKLVHFRIPYIKQRDVLNKQKEQCIVYAGSFVKRIREPEPVFRILVEVSKRLSSNSLFIFYVRNKEAFSEYTELSGGRIRFDSFVKREELYNVLSSSSMLINIGNADCAQIPSKTIEYISFRKPILFFYYDENDSSLEYMNSYPDVCMVNVNNPFMENVSKVITFVEKEHGCISYEDLMKVELYQQSTPDFLRSLL